MPFLFHTLHPLHIHLQVPQMLSSSFFPLTLYKSDFWREGESDYPSTLWLNIQLSFLFEIGMQCLNFFEKIDILYNCFNIEFYEY